MRLSSAALFSTNPSSECAPEATLFFGCRLLVTANARTRTAAAPTPTPMPIAAPSESDLLEAGLPPGPLTVVVVVIVVVVAGVVAVAGVASVVVPEGEVLAAVVTLGADEPEGVSVDVVDVVEVVDVVVVVRLARYAAPSSRTGPDTTSASRWARLSPYARSATCPSRVHMSPQPPMLS